MGYLSIVKNNDYLGKIKNWEKSFKRLKNKKINDSLSDHTL